MEDFITITRLSRGGWLEAAFMPIYRVSNVPGFKVPPPNERVLKVVLSPEVAGPGNFTLLVAIIYPYSTTGLHAHEGDEVMYVASGSGESIIGGLREPVSPDTVIHAPAGIAHEIRNIGDETLKLICFYTPPIEPKGFYGEAVELAKKAVRGEASPASDAPTST
jgi:mannose-6-phosphate isomerase-like protein (cupin superfamily)